MAGGMVFVPDESENVVVTNRLCIYGLSSIPRYA